MARFDWYQATIRADVRDVRAALLGLEAGALLEPIKARHGYAFAERVMVEGVELGQVAWGGSHEHPHAHVSGGAAPLWADELRGRFEHSVSRADVCEDYAEAGAYDRLQAIAVGVARDRGIRVGTAGDHLVTLKGRTVYLGATSSHTRLRLYDKAAELREQFRNDPARLAEVPQELARLEAQVRPQSRQAKDLAAKAAPLELMGSAAWMRELMRQVAGLELAPFQAGRGWRRSDDQRAYAAVLAQYGGLLRRLAGDLGSWECLDLQLRDDLAERDRAARRGGAA